jgi:hypothetical protein
LLRLHYPIRLSRRITEIGCNYRGGDCWLDVLIDPIENIMLAPEQLPLAGQPHDRRQTIEPLPCNVCVDCRGLSMEKKT